jgi:hypothetical protein
LGALPVSDLRPIPELALSMPCVALYMRVSSCCNCAVHVV